MNGYDRVKAAIHFNKPDKFPTINVTTLADILFKNEVLMGAIFPSKSWQPGWRENEVGLFPHPFTDISFRWKKPDWTKDPKYKNWKTTPHEEIDTWGCIWERIGDNSTMGHPGRPSLPDWNKLDDYIETYFMDPKDKSRYNLALLEFKLLGRRRYRMATLGSTGPFIVAANMRGFTQYMADHRRNPDKVKYLLEKLTENFTQQMETLVRLGGKPHGFWINDDLATQDRLFMSPRVFKEFYEPVYRTIYEKAHELGCDFHQHICGKIDELLPILIDWGLDAVELDSPRMTGYTSLRPCRGKIMFWGCINIQSIYVNGTPADCEKEVWHMMRNLGTQDGGFGAYFYPSPNKIKAPRENIQAFKRGIKKYGIYSKIPGSWWDHPVLEEWKQEEINYVPPLPP
ncbi:MAG: uroporphyrinogen decarboxylase family protein [Candidatus Hodarchaeota archaeon]